MKTVVIHGVKYEQLDWVEGFMCDCDVIILRPLQEPKKTLVEIAAEALKYTVDRYRAVYNVDVAIYDAIESRLKALEEKVND